jgi:hypothetical protein
MSDLETGPAAHCPWCSAELPPGTAGSCPSCGATLTSTEGPEPDIRGVTTLDPEAILRARSESSRPRSRLMSFITGDASDSGLDPATAASVAPPADAVRREMLRLRIEAERSALEAESNALRTEVIVEQGIDLASLADEGMAAESAPAGEPDTTPPVPPPASGAAAPEAPSSDAAFPQAPPMAGDASLPAQPPAPADQPPPPPRP